MKQRVMEILTKALPQVDFNCSDSLVDDGILDSLSIVVIMSELSMEYSILFDVDELTPDDFNSVDSIIELIKRTQNIKE